MSHVDEWQWMMMNEWRWRMSWLVLMNDDEWQAMCVGSTAVHSRASTVARPLPAAASSKVTPSSTEVVLVANKTKVTFEGMLRRAYTHRSFYEKERFHTSDFKHKSVYTQKLLHRKPFTHRSYYTEERLHTGTFAQKSVYTQKLLDRDHCTHRSFYA